MRYLTGLEPIGTSARKHLVHTQHVVRVRADAHVEVVLTHGVNHVLVARDAGSLQSLGRQLLVLVGHHVHGARVEGAGLLLSAGVEDADLRVRHTSAKPTLRVRLVLAVTITLVRTAPHPGLILTAL